MNQIIIKLLRLRLRSLLDFLRLSSPEISKQKAKKNRCAGGCGFTGSFFGVDENGTPVSHVRDDVDREEVSAACVEASTSSIGRAFGGGKKKCEEYLGF